MAASFYFVIDHGFNFIIIPWLTTYVICSLVWIVVSIRKIGLGLGEYLKNLFVPIFASIVMAAYILLCKLFLFPYILALDTLYLRISLYLTLGGFIYFTIYYLLDRQMFSELYNSLKYSNSRKRVVEDA